MMEKAQRTVITYGTFDLFHIGHLEIFRRLKEMGDRLIVGVSTDEFNERKGKKTIIPFEDRIEIVRNIKYVDLAIAEEDWSQKVSDVQRYEVSVFGMGHDWKGEFDDLKAYCDVCYLPRTEGISSTSIKGKLAYLDKGHVSSMKEALDVMTSIVESLE